MENSPINGEFMEALYNRIGIGYDETRKADPYIVERFLSFLTPRSEGLYLDIGCGTGNYTNAFRKEGYRFVGIDPSVAMLEAARTKNQEVEWKVGSAEETGLEDASVDGIVASLTLHHWKDLKEGFGEMYRILKSSGRMVIFTTTPEQTGSYWLKHYFPQMIEESARQLPSLERVEYLMETAGFSNIMTENYSVRSDLQDLFLYSGKHQPGLYLQPEVRRGISSFSNLANREEVERGLSRLQEDMESGAIDQVIDDAGNDLGDYLFVIGEKHD